MFIWWYKILLKGALEQLKMFRDPNVAADQCKTDIKVSTYLIYIFIYSLIIIETFVIISEMNYILNFHQMIKTKIKLFLQNLWSKLNWILIANYRKQTKFWILINWENFNLKFLKFLKLHTDAIKGILIILILIK